MATLVTTAPRAARLPGMRRRASNWALPAFTMLAIGYLLIPIAVMILFSFNDYNGKFNFIWNGFTLNAWLHPLAWPGLPEALGTSLRVAVISTFIGTLVGSVANSLE